MLKKITDMIISKKEKRQQDSFQDNIEAIMDHIDKNCPDFTHIVISKHFAEVKTITETHSHRNYLD